MYRIITVAAWSSGREAHSINPSQAFTAILLSYNATNSSNILFWKCAANSLWKKDEHWTKHRRVGVKLYYKFVYKEFVSFYQNNVVIHSSFSDWQWDQRREYKVISK